MLVFSPARISVMLLMTLFTTLIAVSTYGAIREEFGRLSALGAYFPPGKKNGTCVFLKAASASH